MTLLVVAVALAASPTVTPLLSRLAHPVVTAPPLPDLRDVPSTLPDVQRYAAFVQPFQQALTELQVGERRRVTLSETHYALYLHAAPLLGANRTAALMELVSTEIRNQNPGRARRSVFSSPEAALDDARVWLRYLSWATSAPRGTNELQAAAPVPLVPGVVLGHAADLLTAANAAHLAPGMLAAIVDNEQSGQGRLYGLAGVLRDLSDTVALRTAEAYGESGLSGDLSQTVGLAQMSWQDALGQRPRFHELGMTLGRLFPTGEASARLALQDDRSNLLLTASRLVGYLDEQEGREARPHTSARTYFTGPGWHNNPALLSGGQTWPYAWNGFFKACLYGALLRS
ncbi:hypothetical protein GCM10008939_07050 [Deinococcus aquiradiocola]|uniref:Uncharacterized protein n=1 Tax=Deinococcus aquiradiocola TaxID=393059 RepID=A0A917UL31_9DEIO|nr:hypothetical protein GCM10008939_07050 [Deinococcus aquiradiocola]